jgi:hypothetical protein
MIPLSNLFKIGFNMCLNMSLSPSNARKYLPHARVARIIIKDTKILTFSINAHHWIHSGGPTSTPSDLFLTAVDRAKESVRKILQYEKLFF